MKHILKNIFHFFMQGLMFIAPMGLTLYFLYWCFIFVDSFTAALTLFLFGTKIPGVGIVITFLIITLFGVIGKSLFLRPIVSFTTKVFSMIPVIKNVHKAFKDVISALIGNANKFTDPVLFRLSENSDTHLIGFITQNNLTNLGLDNEMVSVYVPIAYSITGIIYIVPKHSVTHLDVNHSEILKFILSGGLTNISDKK